MPNFDWVRERINCSPGGVFEQLALDVRTDVDTMNSQRKPNDQTKIEFVRNHNRFSVALLPSNAAFPPINFSIAGEVIRVENGSSIDLTATLTLSDAGECRLRVHGAEKEQWQFRRMALEELFFNSSFLRRD